MSRPQSPSWNAILLAGALVLALPARAAAPDAPASPTTSSGDGAAPLLRQAGNSADESIRLGLLCRVRGLPDLEAQLRSEIDALLPVVEAWANGRSHAVTDHSRAAENGYLCRFIDRRFRPAGQGEVQPPEPAPSSPLHPLWAFYRARLLVWQVIQSGPLLRVPESRNAYYGEARRLFTEARDAYPDNRVIRMYLGEPIPWPAPFSPDPQAPEWANLQREGLEKLADLIHWWIRERQLEDGQFGGGWGDDVEMWRWWTPVLIGFDDPEIATAQERLSSGLFRQPHLAGGFTSRLTDVEHSNEDTTDTILPMMHLRPEDPVWSGRALRLAELMRDRWTGTNHHGFLQFRSIYFGADVVDDRPGRAFDTVYHPAIIQPTLLYWQRTRDAGLTELFGGWLQLWVDATARTGQGKPSGVLPSTIHWPDGGFGVEGRSWWEPFPAGHNDALYNWPGASRLMTSTLLLAWHVTRDERFLEPIHSMAALLMRRPRDGVAAEPGSEAWCAGRIGGFLPDTLAKYRLLSGNPRYDELLREQGGGYSRFRLTGDRRPLLAQLTRHAGAFRSNWEAYTSEMRWTDRVVSFTRNYLEYLPEPAPPAPAPEVLYSMATGDPGNPLVFPLNAVRWLTRPRELAVLVTDAGPTRFSAEVFHFGAGTRQLSAELYLLEPGNCRVTVEPVAAASGLAASVRQVRFERRGGRVVFEVPSRVLCRVVVGRDGAG